MKKIVIHFHIKNYYFSSAVLPLLMFLTVFSLLISLGIWQIQRGSEKKRIQAEFSKQKNTRPILLNQVLTIPSRKPYLPALAYGHFDNQHHFLLDNKIHQHQIGYEVLTPFILNNSATVILVNRGWIPQGQNRKTLPKINAVPGNITIQGAIVWPTKTFSFKTISELAWPQRIQTLDPAFLAQQHLQAFILVINTRQPYGFTPARWPALTLDANRHYAYALQWFGLSVTLLIAFFASHIARL